MSDHERSELAELKALRNAEAPDDVRQRIVSGALVRTQRRSSWALPLLATAASVAAAWALWAPRPTPSTTTLPAAPTVAQLPARILPDPGALVDVVKTEDALTEVALRAGRVVFHVDHRPAGSVFRVRTDEAIVEVVGTRFSVNREDTCTIVEVVEGQVRVTGREVRLLSAGEEHRECAPTPSVAIVKEPGQALVHGALDQILAGRDLDGAAAKLETYLAKHPRGVFAEEALFHATLLRAQAPSDPRARTLGERFLEAFPTGPRAKRVRALLNP